MSDDAMTLTDVVALSVVMGTLMVTVLGAMFLSYRKQALRSRQAAPDDHAAMQNLLDTARRMEQRISYLERVLDTEAPGWRSRSSVG